MIARRGKRNRLRYVSGCFHHHFSSAIAHVPILQVTCALNPLMREARLGLLALSAKTLHLRRPVGIFLTRRKNSRSYGASHQWVRAGHAGHILECPQKRVNEDQLFTRRLDPQCSIMAYTEVILCRSPLRGNVLLRRAVPAPPQTPFLANLPDGCPIRIVKFLSWCDVATAIMVGEGSFGRQKTRLIGSANWIPPAGIHRRR